MSIDARFDAKTLKWGACLFGLWLCLVAPLSYGATSASGPIVSGTTWTVAQSPYTVTGDVTVENGATLSIEAGVTVYMDAGTSLIVNNGALQANGTAALPVTFTSYQESLGGQAAPGDWGSISFHAGVNSATFLNHVNVKFGQGLVLTAASPILNFVNLTQNAGAAISMDLASSPSGQGNAASGNGSNGIVVSDGDIVSNVTWSLEGIPYVIGGSVSVGQSPAVTGVTPTEVPQGGNAAIQIFGVRLSGAQAVVFDNPGVTATLLPGATDSNLPLRVTAGSAVPFGSVPFEVRVAAGRVRVAPGVTVANPLPPIAISGISPSSIRRDQTIAFQATGANLNGAQVSVSGSGFSIANLQTSASNASFDLTASSGATLGSQTLTFTNPSVASGSASATLNVLPALPVVSVSPTPLAAPPDGAQHAFTLGLSAADTLDHVFTLTVADPTVATVTPGSVTIPAGQTGATLSLEGLKNGQTTLSIGSDLGTTVVPIYVTPEFSGLNTSYSRLLGVVVEAASTAPPGTPTALQATPVGVTVGSYLGSVAPDALIVGTGPTSLVISGQGLQAVSSVAMSPADGITLGTPVPSADGTSVAVPVTVDPAAAATPRQVIVASASGRVPPATPTADRIRIVPPKPVVNSVTPIYATPGTSQVALTLRGQYFQNLLSVNVSPATGITVAANPAVSPDGTQATLNLAVAADAPTGARSVTVTTLSGTSDATPTVANTFTIVSQIQRTVSPIASPNLGVVLSSSAPPPTSSLTLGASPVGVVLGSVVRNLSPSSGIIGTSFTLTLQGRELSGVTAVNVVPNTGVTLGTLTPSADGTSVSVPVTVAPDAPQNLRTVMVAAGTTPIPFATPEARLFRVTAPQPRIDSVDPLYLTVGASPVPLTIRGANFANAQQVAILPPDGLTISSPPVASADGGHVTVNVAAAAGAATGPRVVTVTTPAGTTTSTAGVQNTVTLTAASPQGIGPITAPLVGVVLQAASTQPATRDVGLTATQLGVVLQSTPAPAPTTTVFGVAPLLGVALGPYATSVSGGPFLDNTTATLTVTGSGLDAVTGVALYPADAITMGTPQANSDGTQLTVTLTIGQAAAGARQIALQTASGNVPFVNAQASQIRIAAGAPLIQSISPILAAPGTTLTLTVRGANLQGASVVTATPGQGVTVGAGPVVSGDGTQLTVQLGVAVGAPAGASVIRVVTPGGTTGAAADPSNTFTVNAP